MAIDWISTLKEQSDFINEVARDVSLALASQNLSIAQASRIYRSIERGAQGFDRVMDELESDHPDTGLIDAAGAIADLDEPLSGDR